jgi:Mor family transcriptional regulator
MRGWHGFETQSLPNSLAAYPGGFTFYVADPASSIETRSSPDSLAAYPGGFTFYLADPVSSIARMAR